MAPNVNFKFLTDLVKHDIIYHTIQFAMLNKIIWTTSLLIAGAVATHHSIPGSFIEQDRYEQSVARRDPFADIPLAEARLVEDEEQNMHANVNQCAICLEDFQEGQKRGDKLNPKKFLWKCAQGGHDRMVHKACMKERLHMTHNCPVCDTQLRDARLFPKPPSGKTKKEREMEKFKSCLSGAGKVITCVACAIIML